MLELYRRIKNRREELNMTQDTLAKRVGYKSRTSIHKIELGLTDLPQSKIMEIANALSTTPEYLIGWTPEVSKRINKDETELVNGYRNLSNGGKRLVKDMIEQLSFSSVQSINQAIVLHYTRAGHVENIHRGDVAAVNCKGEVVASVGNAHLPMFWRSAAKPFQALPFVKNGGLEKYGITDEELALLVASHSGEDNHVALVRGILAKLGLDESVLDCGVVRPMSGKAFKKIIAAGEKVLPVHNPCSGKHSQIIALSMMLGIPYEGYIRPDHEAQKIIFKHVAMASRMPEDKLEIGIDGCGVPVFYLPIYNMSLAYARLSTPSKGDWGDYEEAATKIRDAMSKYPQIISGTGRIDLAVSKVTNGRIIAKIGSDAVYCLAVKNGDLGITFKIEDGSYAAVTPMTIAVLKHLDLLTKDEATELDKIFPPVLKNHRGEIIGTIETVF